MKPNRSIDPPLRACKWMLVLGCVVLVLLRLWVEHRFVMELPMLWRHTLQLAGDTLLLALMVVVFALVMRYENHLAAQGAELKVRNEALERLEELVDTRLVALSQKLALSLASVTSQAQLALQRTDDLADIKAFSRVIDEANSMNHISDELLELKQLEADMLMRDAFTLPQEPVLARECREFRE